MRQEGRDGRGKAEAGARGRSRHAAPVPGDASTDPTLPSVETILSADREVLVRTWRQLHGSAPPRSMSQPLLRRVLAFDLQLSAAGGWPEGLEARLTRLAAGGERPRAAEPKAGGRLLREWNGITHVVEITPDGYRWKGQTWRSLSVIAREITGAHWSGPRFFGLNAERKASDKKPRQTPARAGRADRGRGGPAVPSRPSAPTGGSPRHAEARP